jgi:hypothetical protein
MSSEEFMRKEFTLNLDSLTDLEEFVHLLISKISADVDGCYEHQIVDAKSFMGMVSISTHPVTVRINSDDEKEVELFNGICSRYSYSR